MLKIRKEQQKVFREREVQGFEDRMWDHLSVLFPAYCETLGEPAVRRLVRHGIARGARYGLVSERGVCVYVDAMFAFGRDFDVDPALPWAAKILKGRAYKDPALRADALFDEAIEHLEEARGIRAEEAV